MLMMRPYRCLNIGRSAALLQLYALFRFVRKTTSQSSSLIIMSSMSRVVPALLTRMSTRPKRSIVSLTKRCASASRLTSACTATALPPASQIGLDDLVRARGAVAVVHDHGRAVRRQVDGDGRANAPRGAGDDCDFAFEHVHPLIAMPGAVRALGLPASSRDILWRAHVRRLRFGHDPLHQSGQHLARADLDEAARAQLLQLEDRPGPLHAARQLARPVRRGFRPAFRAGTRRGCRRPGTAGALEWRGVDVDARSHRRQRPSAASARRC